MRREKTRRIENSSQERHTRRRRKLDFGLVLSRRTQYKLYVRSARAKFAPATRHHDVDVTQKSVRHSESLPNQKSVTSCDQQQTSSQLTAHSSPHRLARVDLTNSSLLLLQLTRVMTRRTNRKYQIRAYLPSSPSTSQYCHRFR